MRIRYSQEADALYIRLKETKIEDTDEVSEDLIIDYDTDGSVVGIEVLAASEKADMEPPEGGGPCPRKFQDIHTK